MGLTGYELGPFLFDQLFLAIVEFGFGHHSNQDQMLFDDVAELRNDRWHERATGFPVATSWVEYRLEFIHKKCHVAALTKDRRHNSGQRNDPLIMIEIF